MKFKPLLFLLLLLLLSRYLLKFLKKSHSKKTSSFKSFTPFLLSLLLESHFIRYLPSLLLSEKKNLTNGLLLMYFLFLETSISLTHLKFYSKFNFSPTILYPINLFLHIFLKLLEMKLLTFLKKIIEILNSFFYLILFEIYFSFNYKIFKLVLIFFRRLMNIILVNI